MAIDIMRGHVRLDFMVKDNRVDAKEYWSERGRDVTQFDPATEYAQQTILPLFPDDSPDLLAAEAVLDAHLRSSRLRAHRSASEASEGLLRGRSVCTIASLSAASSDAAGLLLWALDNKNDSRNNLRPLALAASSVAASLCAQRLRRRLEGLCGAASASSSLIAAVGSKRRLSALSEASTVAAGLLRGACCARVPRASAEAAGLLRCRAQRVLYKAVAGASAGCAATLRGARCPVVRELVPAAVAAQALLAGAVGRADYVGFVPRGVERAQACFRARGVASAHRGRVGAAEACQALVRLTRTAPRPADIAGLAAASRLAQGLVCAAGIHARFREVVGASEAFQGVAVAASEGVAFLLYVIVAVWAQGAVRTSLAGSRNARMAATTREAQGLFRTAFQQNCRFRPALALVRYTQGVIADRKLEAIRAAEHAKRVASAAATASASPLMMRGGDGSGGQAQKKSDTFVSIDSFKVDLSKHNFASTIPTKRPVWVPDSFSNTCSICAKNFSFGNRRHHCRNCGNLVCTQCTIFMPLVHLGYEKPVRVCKPCRDFLLSAK